MDDLVTDSAALFWTVASLLEILSDSPELLVEALSFVLDCWLEVLSWLSALLDSVALECAESDSSASFDPDEEASSDESS